MTGLRCHLYIPHELRAQRPQRRPKELERREVRREQNDASAFRERGSQVLGAFDIDALRARLRAAEPAHRHLDERQAERLEVLLEYLARALGGQLGQARGDVARRDAPAVAQQRVSRRGPSARPSAICSAKRQQHDEPHPRVAEPRDGVAQRWRT